MTLVILMKTQYPQSSCRNMYNFVTDKSVTKIYQ